MSEQVFQIPEDALQAINDDLLTQIRALSWGLPAITAIIGIGIGVLGFLSWRVIIITYIMVFVIQVLLMANYLRIQEESWESLRIILSDDGIRREEAGRKAIAISRDEIMTVHDLDDGPLVIEYDGGRRMLGVPRELDGFEAIRGTVLGWVEGRE